MVQTMRKTLFVALLFAAMMPGQVFRVDPTPVMTTAGTAPASGFPALYAVAGSRITLCTDATCTTTATSYSDHTGGTACPAYAPVTVGNSPLCVPNTGPQGQFGFWVQPGTYWYTATLPVGTVYGPFPFTTSTTGVTSLIAGPGITISSGTGTVTISTRGDGSYNVMSFGATGNAVALTAGSIGAGDATFVDTGAAFTAADVGKTIVVQGAGTAGAQHITTIASLNGAAPTTSIELTAAAVTAVSGAASVYGTDDTAAFVSALGSGSRKVTVPPGGYVISAALAIPTKTTVEGTRGSSILYCISSTLDCLSVTSGNYNKISGLYLKGSLLKTAGSAVILTSSAWATIENLDIESFHFGIKLTSTTAIWTRNVNCLMFGPNSDCIYVDGSGNDHNFDNVISDWSGSYYRAGLHVKTTGGMFVSNSDFIHANTAVIVDPPSGGNVIAMNMSKVYLDSSGVAGLYVFTTGSGAVDPIFGPTKQINGLSCTDCRAAGSVGPGVTINGDTTGGSVEGILLRGLLAFNNGTYGVVMGNNISLVDSVVKANSQAVSGAAPNVVVTAGATNVKIQDSDIGGDFFTTTEKASRAIQLNSGATDYYSITGNQLTAGVTDTFSNAATGTHYQIHGNLPASVPNIGPPEWRKYSLVSILNGAPGCTHVDGCWTVNGVYNSDRAASGTQDPVLFQLPANGYVSDTRIKPAVACDGKTATASLGGLGLTGNVTYYQAKTVDLNTVSAANVVDITAAKGSTTAAAINVVASLAATGNIENLAADCAVDYWLLWGVLR